MNRTRTPITGNLILAIASSLSLHASAQNTGDYRSAGSGDWSSSSTWQIFNGSTFVAAPGAPGSNDGVISIRATHTVTRNADITIDQVVVEANGTLAITGGTFSLDDGTGPDLQILGTCSLTTATFSGPGLVQVGSGGVLGILNGGLNATSVVSVLAGGTVNADGSGTVSALGTINNSGTWNMEGGNLGQPSFAGGPCAFNNLPGGVVNLNDWASTTNTWHQATVNQGTFNKNNGSVPFTFSDDFSGKSFTNQSGGVVNVASDELIFSCPTTNAGVMSTQAGGTALVNTAAAGTFTNSSGGSLQGTFRQNGGTLVLEGPVSITQFLFEGGVVSGPEALTIPTGETFNWTGGGFSANAVLNIQSGAIATVSGTGTRAALGTINNSGTWNMEGGNLGQPSFASGPCAFNNLPSGVVNLNGWESNTNSWHQVTNNQGTFTKNNGIVPFTFSNDFSAKSFNNLAGGVLNVAAGECVFSVPTTNEGSMTGGAGSLIKVDGSSSGGFFTNEPGGTVSTAFHLVSSDLNINSALTFGTFTLSGGTVNGPEDVTVPSSGTFTWTGGTIGSTAVINITAGASATFSNAGEARGTINNAGTWTLLDGVVTGGPNSPAAFNNLPGGVVDLNGWPANVEAWHMVTTNQGTFNKNNGNVLFTFGNAFAQNPKSFTNAAGGVVNVNSGTLAFNLPFPVQNGTFNVAAGTTLSSAEPFDFAGPAIVNNGSITAPVLRCQGTNAQQLNGEGNINNLAIDNAAGVDLGGDQTVTGVLTLTNGQLRLGSNDLFVENNASGAVGGGNANSWVVNNGTGSLHRQVNGSNYLYPVGTSSYTPLTLSLTNGPQDRFSVRVNDGLSTDYSTLGAASGATIVDHAVDRTWVVAEDVNGGNTADITLQWGSADQLPLFNGSLSTVSRYDGTAWQTGSFAAASGSDPFTRSLSGVSAFREFGVIDDLLDLSTAVDGPDGSVAVAPVLYPQPANEVLHVVAAEGRLMSNVTLLDASGRIALRTSMNATVRATLDVSSLAPGLYVLEWNDAKLGLGRAPIVIAR